MGVGGRREERENSRPFRQDEFTEEGSASSTSSVLFFLFIFTVKGTVFYCSYERDRLARGII